MTQTRWGDGDASLSRDQAEVLNALRKQMHKRMDEHFGGYEPMNLMAVNPVDELLHDFTIVLTRLEGFDRVCHLLECDPSGLELALKIDFIERYEDKLKEGKREW